MKIFVTGATGALGRPAVRALLAAGHDVRAVARTPEKADAVRAAGAEPVTVDLFDAPAIADAVSGCDAIAHFATHVPKLTRAARTSGWAEHNRIRTEATANLLAAARTHGIERFVKESVVFMYPDSGDEWIDESVPFVDSDNPFVTGTRNGEQLVEEYTAEGGRGVVLRFGLFYGFGNRATPESIKLARFRRSTVFGKRDAYMSAVHNDDTATAVVAAVDAPSGIYNVVDDEPMTRQAYLDAFTAAFELPTLHPSSAWMIRPMAGADPTRVLTASQRVSNRKFCDTTGWAPRYKSAREGWAAVAAVERPGHRADDQPNGQVDQQGVGA